MPIKELVELFRSRDEIYAKLTEELLESVRETLLEAAVQYFNADIVWYEVMLFKGNVSASGVMNDEEKKLVRVSVPLDYIENGTKESIVEFFEKMANEPPLFDEDDSDLSELTDDQLAKLKLYEKTHNPGGNVH